MFMLIQSCSSQWHALNLTMPIDLYAKFFRGDPLEAPHLTHLQLHQLDVFLRPQPHILITAPSLDTIAISNINMTGLKLDYSRITRVSTVGISGDGVFLLLKTATRLESATFLESAFNISAVPWGPHVHESLTHLEFRLKESGEHPFLPHFHFLDVFTLPRLQQLSISFAHANGDLQNKLFDFLSRSQCSLVCMELTDLSVWAPHTGVSKLMEILEIVPSLTHLRLSSGHHAASSFLAQQIFRRLRGMGIAPQEYFLPNLESLDLEQIYSPDSFLYLSDIFMPSKRPLQTVQLTLVMDYMPLRPVLIPHIALAQLRLLQNMSKNQEIQFKIIGRYGSYAGKPKVDLVEESWKVYGGGA